MIEVPQPHIRHSDQIAQRLLFVMGISGLVLMLSLLMLNFSHWAENMVRAASYPFQLDYGEGIVWQQAIMIMQGKGYGSITEPPYIVFHYPPIFHVTASLVARLFSIDGLMAGRLVSIFSTFGSAVIVGSLVWRSIRLSEGRLVASLAGLCAALVPFAFMPVAFWSAMYRVDMLALFLSLIGTFLGLSALKRPWQVYLSAIFFVLAALTKQTSICASLACFTIIVFRNPRLAMKALATTLVIGALAIAEIDNFTDGRFLQHVLYYNINRFDIKNIIILIWQIKYHYILIVISIFWIHNRIANRNGKPILQWLRLVLTNNDAIGGVDEQKVFSIIYLLLTTIALSTVLKSGANYNYFVEWAFALSLIIGFVLSRPIANVCRELHQTGLRQELIKSLAISPIAFLAVSIQLAMFSPQPAFFQGASATQLQQYTELQRRMRDAAKPVISDDMVLLVRSGKDVFLEPAIIAELTATGTWHESKLLKQIDERQFAFFVTEGSYGDALFEARYSPEVRKHLKTSYSRQEMVAGYWIHQAP